MMNKKYEPSFLISADVPEELHKQLTNYANAHDISEEEVYRMALRYFATNCVHTHGRRKNHSR